MKTRPKPPVKKYATGGPVTKHQSLATSGSAPDNGRSDPGFKKGGAVKRGGKRAC